jgi:hypothetical protein
MTHNVPRQVLEYKRVPRDYLERYVHVEGLGTGDVAICCIAEDVECTKTQKFDKGRLCLWPLLGFSTLP